ncbi:response regulator receiver domain-containing protein [Catenovulum agarivorans DS-2]|uniref:Response regulator receiver domain-containing protein n=1 Tax=Catenovulum agarivorans DS-2 TaxID=1328313 RepID=W7QF15_9ALTE|nr:LytTR family DNA-binding domain-containing protein [Catenovulum agarivorans]EWH11489.1 response regulator receiver domain-containing protein [Catenovulum agarivorans DS-2]
MRTLLVEDSYLAREDLKAMLAKHPEIELVAEASNVTEALELVAMQQAKKQAVELILLDIHLPEQDGFALLEQIDAELKVIFITAYSEFAIKSFDYHTVDYLVKPVHPKRLAAAIKKLQVPQTGELGDTNTAFSEQDRIFVKDGDNCYLVALKNIQRIESCGNHSLLYFYQYNHASQLHKAFVYKSLVKLAERLPEQMFFRANRQNIVNLTYVENVEPWVNGGFRLTLNNGHEVEVSRRHASQLKNNYAF